MTGTQICDPTIERAHFRWQYAMAVFALLAVLLTSLPATAQQTRAEELAAKQAEKARTLHPYEPNKAEKLLLKFEQKGLLGQPEGFFPALGSAYRTGGFAAGARYFNRFEDDGLFGIVGLWSIKNYKLAQADFQTPRFLGNKVQIGATAQYLDAPSLPFYGIGQNSEKDDKTDYEYSPVTFGANATITPVKWFYFGGGAEYLDITTKEGDIPNIFPPPVVPGLGLDPTYIRSHVFAAIDWRQSPGYSTSGGWYRADFYDYDQRNNEGNFSFRQLDAQVIQLFPILRANWIIAVRALASLTYVDEGNQVPFFLLPNLGGGRDLRGYPDFRFMDNNRILWTVEYRWTPSKFMDMVIFYEAGKVTADRDDLDFDGLVNSYGIGTRLHGPMSTPIRIEFAHSDEYNRIIFAFNPAW